MKISSIEKIYFPCMMDSKNHSKCSQTKQLFFLISSFRRVMYVVHFLLGNSLTSRVYMPTFQNTLSVPSS